MYQISMAIAGYAEVSPEVLDIAREYRNSTSDIFYQHFHPSRVMVVTEHM